MGADRSNPSKEGPALDWCCPACAGHLESSGHALRCSACGADYPRVGRLPLLAKEARGRLSVSAASLGARRKALTEEIAALAPDRIDPRLHFRLAVLERRREGLRRALAIVEAELSDVLEGIVRNGGPVANDAASPESATRDSGLLFTDWGKSAEGEGEVSLVTALARELAGALPPAHEARALFLGAGTGRHAIELGRAFGASRAIDFSLERMWLFDRVLQRPLDIALFEDVAPLNSGTLTRFARTQPPAVVPGLQLAIADARHLPLPSESITHVFSLYFSDILPLPELLPEVARVLAPGGVFVHVGPLDYAVTDSAWRLAPDELDSAFRQFGFYIEAMREELLERGTTESSALRLQYRGLAFRARKIR